ncbi:hypothetical protein [Bacillus sp. CHD6a]|uniref:hypothetical protein n=1 Tax=Bacillus sp. CHD6a TaxID=1643452 RepID=UPI0006CC4555|nr:hypothetical protein [Bacillus sp. CHD6a]KPB06028.1 hypothetical protein AAV98_03665 [Bacillus sp. CHD6a]
MDMTLNEFFEPYSSLIEHIEESRNYWLVRTDSGKYYSDFSNNNYISIGWDEFSNINDFRNKAMSDAMSNYIINKYPKKQPRRIYNQIRKFLFEIKVGDVVMIPNENSKVINFGIVTSEYISRANNINDTCPFIKSKSVKWIKEIDREKLDPYLFKMMQAHQTINSANEYAHFIDRTMYSFYEKSGKSYLILPVNKEEDIPAYDLSQFINAITNLVPIANVLQKDSLEDEYNKRDLDIKINVQSPGYIELKSDDAKLVPRILTLLKYLIGNNDCNTERLLEKTSEEELRKLKKDRDDLRKRFEDVKAKLPSDI